MRVLYDGQIFGVQKYGGISRYFYELAKHITKDFQVSASIAAPIYVNEYLLGGGVDVQGFAVAQLPRTSRIIEYLNRKIAPYYESRIKPEIVHETYYRGIARVRGNCKTVTTVHDMVHERFPSSFPSDDRTAENKKRAVEKSDLVLCDSENTKKDLVELLGINPVKIKTVHLGLNAKAWQLMPATQVIRERPFFLYVGERAGYKNFEGLLKAYSQSRELMGEFDIVAFGGGTMTKDQRLRIAELGIAPENVRHLHGSDAVLKGLYKAATAFVYPSKYEGFGIPPLEAMIFNCPVLCSNQSSIPEIVGDAGVYFDPYDSDSLTAKLEAIRDTKLRLKLASLGRERVQAFSWGKCASETIQAYRELLGK